MLRRTDALTHSHGGSGYSTVKAAADGRVAAIEAAATISPPPCTRAAWSATTMLSQVIDRHASIALGATRWTHTPLYSRSCSSVPSSAANESVSSCRPCTQHFEREHISQGKKMERWRKTWHATCHSPNKSQAESGPRPLTHGRTIARSHSLASGVLHAAADGPKTVANPSTRRERPECSHPISQHAGH